MKEEGRVEKVFDTAAKTVLVVDDEATIRTLYSEELEEEGYRVVAVGSAREGLEQVRQGEIDLVVLDIRMPDMDGLEFLGHAREIDMNIPIVICTAYSSYKQNFEAWGADAYVVKSSDLTELKEKVKALI